MGKFITKMLIMIILFVAVALPENKPHSNSFIVILREQQLNLETKSIQGWIRLLNDSDKLRLYGLDNYSDEKINQAKEDIQKLQILRLGEIY